MAPHLSPFVRESAMLNPRQLVPTVGPEHGGLEFLKGSFSGIKGYAVGRMTKSCRSKIYINDARWGPEADSIEYGYQAPFSEIHVFIGKISKLGPEPDICTDIIETTQRARPAKVQAALKCAFVGFTQGVDLEGGSVSGGETAVYSGDESSTGETNSMYQLQDDRLGGCSNGDSISDPCEPPNWVAIFMDGTQPVQNSSTAATMFSGSAAATAAGAGGPMRPLAQVFSELLEVLATLLMVEVTPANQAQHNMDVAKLRDEIAQAKEDLNVENARMATERAALEVESQQIQS
ncbi:uncharacterized protein [Aegilops tauschii subsp. strangulata]|uniref:uncharacterized protein n=1 Tax=Aegilops tauschii subsp. strangulata TaxID=200361 RepID=UPI003CC8977E